MCMRRLLLVFYICHCSGFFCLKNFVETVYKEFCKRFQNQMRITQEKFLLCLVGYRKRSPGEMLLNKSVLHARTVLHFQTGGETGTPTKRFANVLLLQKAHLCTWAIVGTRYCLYSYLTGIQIPMAMSKPEVFWGAPVAPTSVKFRCPVGGLLHWKCSCTLK